MELHDDVGPYAFLLGTWTGPGRGHYPTIEPFTYTETLTFAALPGKPFLRLEQRTASPEGRPMHTEVGFLRFPGAHGVELVLAQPTGQTELLEGESSADRRTLTLASTSVARTATAKRVDATERVYTLDEAGTRLRTLFRMAAVGEDMTDHLHSDLIKEER